MANVNKINLANVNYDIEDTQARLDANAAMQAASQALDQLANGGTPPTPATGTCGARWYKTQSLTMLDRINDAVGLTFAPSIGSQQGHSDFDSLFPWSEIKRCVVVNGAVMAYEGDPGFSLTPGSGDVMVEIPAFYYQILETAQHRDFIISNLDPSVVTTPPAGFQLSPRHAPTASKPAGWDKIYVSAYSLDSAYRSISGNASIVSITRATARTQCKARGAGYQPYDFATLATIQLLYLVEVANWDSQAAVGPGYTDAGNTGQINTGGADGVAWHTGRANGDANAAKNAVKYRGMENLWGNIWAWCDGINFNNATTYINLDPATYADDTATNYLALVYSKAVADGFQKMLGFDPTYPFAQICTDATGADGTFISDNYWQSAGWRVLAVGGNWNNAANAGLFCFNSNNLSSNLNTNIGARLFVCKEKKKRAQPFPYRLVKILLIQGGV